MNNFEKLVEQHVNEYVSRLQHIDELMDAAHKEVEPESDDAETATELNDLKKQRDEFADYIEDLKRKSPEQLMQAAGPMVIWEFIAQRLENLVEKIKV